VGSASETFTRFMKEGVLGAFCGQTSIPLDLTGKQLLILGMDRERRDVVGPLVATVLHMLVTRNVAQRRQDPLIVAIVDQSRPGDRVLLMSNGDFGGVHGRLLRALTGRAAQLAAEQDHGGEQHAAGVGERQDHHRAGMQNHVAADRLAIGANELVDGHGDLAAAVDNLALHRSSSLRGFRPDDKIRLTKEQVRQCAIR